ncbi:MAG TPA: ATP-grasp domain-containing protein [Ktedonobacterales bacterium]|nr:ATP-grasp domain-containing protein [Ktedonobacterales bacterium]
MRLIFCADPLGLRPGPLAETGFPHSRSRWSLARPYRRLVDALYEREAEAAQQAGLEYTLLNVEALVDEQDALAATRRIAPAAAPEVGVYRGWMLRPAAYERLYEALAALNIFLINMPLAYRHCHYLPESYPVIEGHTPRSIWLKLRDGPSIEQIMDALQPFGDKPLILKDYVKSRKHEWAEACYIPSAADRAAVERVVKRFLELQGPELNEGLVFREFVSFEPLASHAKSGMPLTKEFRIFFLDGERLLTAPYWETGAYGDLLPPADLFQEVARHVQSRFFTMDVARRVDGAWMIVELGDGQVAGLPEQADAGAFYRALAQKIAA